LGKGWHQQDVVEGKGFAEQAHGDGSKKNILETVTVSLVYSRLGADTARFKSVCLLSFNLRIHNRVVCHISHPQEVFILLRRIFPNKIWLLPVLILASASWANTPTTFTLSELEKLTLDSSFAVKATQEAVNTAIASVNTARAFPNPEIEASGGQQVSRLNRVEVGPTQSWAISQPLDMPWQRVPRVDAASAGLQAEQAHQRAFTTDLIAKLRLRYFDLIRRQAEERASREDSKLMEGIRSRIALRVETGEAARYELVKADAETLNAQKLAQSAELRTRQSRAALRAVVGAQLPADFQIDSSAPDLPRPAPLAQVKTALILENPLLAKARAERLQLTHKLSEQKALRLPQLAVKAAIDQDQEFRNRRIGLALTVPLWDSRAGPIGEAASRLSRADNEVSYQEFSLVQELDAAYQQYDIAQAQMMALESGIVRQAGNALRIVEIAYRAGEKGFLEVLDAQRVFRAARNELITARYELASAWAEIERLRATPTP
jgi:cobalt-zinc-cadmium efflux system outer membrane protein